MNHYQEKLIVNLKQASHGIEQYQLIAALLDEGLKASEISKKSNMQDYTVRHHARLHRKLAQSVKDLFLSGKISFSLARAIAGLPSKQQEAFARKAIAKHISVQSFRQSLKANDDAGLLREMERLSEQLSQLSGLDIKIQPDKHNAQAGVWVVRYADLTMFDVICERFTGKKSLEDY